jgi:hypothetical protein
MSLDTGCSGHDQHSVVNDAGSRGGKSKLAFIRSNLIKDHLHYSFCAVRRVSLSQQATEMKYHEYARDIPWPL